MAAASETIQTIARLMPLADVLAAVDLAVKPVALRTLDVTAAAGRMLAADAVAAAAAGRGARAHRRLGARADATLGAGGYAPVQLLHPPHRIGSRAAAGHPTPTAWRRSTR